MKKHFFFTLYLCLLPFVAFAEICRKSCSEMTDKSQCEKIGSFYYFFYDSRYGCEIDDDLCISKEGPCCPQFNRQCAPGFKLEGSSRCWAPTSNGTSCMDNTKSCNNNYFYNPSTKECSPCPEGYATCDLMAYGVGQTLFTKDTASFGNITYCSTVTGNDLCRACSWGSGGATCTACMAGYTLAHYGTPGTCSPCRYEGCLNCDNDINSCSECAQGYSLGGDGICYSLCEENCSLCSAGRCSQCKNGYKLLNGKCVSNSVVSCPEGLVKSVDGCCCLK